MHTHCVTLSMDAGRLKSSSCARSTRLAGKLYMAALTQHAVAGQGPGCRVGPSVPRAVVGMFGPAASGAVGPVGCMCGRAFAECRGALWGGSW